MRRIVVLLVAALALVPAGLAQNGDPGQFQGYGFIAPGALIANGGGGGSTGALHLGGGFEIFAARNLTVGGEVGYIAPFRAFGDGLGTFSANGSYHFYAGDSDRKVVPFVTGGYTMLFRGGTTSGGNFGGGVTLWPKERFGIRLEARDHIHKFDGATLHSLTARISFVFR
jgi:hypothetical protein